LGVVIGAAGEVYLPGLMLDGKRKSIEPMAARLADGDEQCLQQFVNQSPWEWQPVRAMLARRLSAAIVPQAWIVDDSGFPKFGRYSVGVARQCCGALGKVGNCQIDVSINAATAGLRVFRLTGAVDAVLPYERWRRSA
jgi:SRSO17 transposase